MQYPVFWALALAGVAALLVVGGSWLIHVRIYQGEIDRLQQQLSATLREVTASAEARIDSTRAELQAQLQELLRNQALQLSQQLLELQSETARCRADDRQRLQGELGTLANAVQARMDAVDGRSADETLALRAEMAQLRAEVQQLLQLQDKTIRQDFAGTQRDVGVLWDSYHGHEKAYARHRADAAQKFKDLGKKLQSIEAVAMQAEESIWEVRGVPINVLRSQFLVLQAAVDADEQRRVELVLARILKTVATLVAARQRCDPWTLDRVRETVGRAMAMMPGPAAEVLALLDKVSQEAPA
jgi:hypothetical protein